LLFRCGSNASSSRPEINVPYSINTIHSNCFILPTKVTFTHYSKFLTYTNLFHATIFHLPQSNKNMVNMIREHSRICLLLKRNPHSRNMSNRNYK
jgi:hypothetical protein